MKKSIKKISVFILMFVLVACFGDDTIEGNNGNGYEFVPELIDVKIEDLEEVPGVDPFIERYPNSVRGQCIINAYCVYYAEATIDEVLDFYRNLASEKGQIFNYEIISEERPHWVTTYADPANPASDEFAFTLGEAENICVNCVKVILYAHDWPE